MSDPREPRGGGRAPLLVALHHQFEEQVDRLLVNRHAATVSKRFPPESDALEAPGRFSSEVDTFLRRCAPG